MRASAVGRNVAVAVVGMSLALGLEARAQTWVTRLVLGASDAKLSRAE